MLPILAFCHALFISILSLFLTSNVSVFSKFAVTWPGYIPASKSWGPFQVEVASGEPLGQEICSDRQCWTVYSSLNNTSDTLVLETRPATMHLWRWVQNKLEKEPTLIQTATLTLTEKHYADGYSGNSNNSWQLFVTWSHLGSLSTLEKSLTFVFI